MRAGSSESLILAMYVTTSDTCQNFRRGWNLRTQVGTSDIRRATNKVTEFWAF